MFFKMMKTDPAVMEQLPKAPNLPNLLFVFDVSTYQKYLPFITMSIMTIWYAAGPNQRPTSSTSVLCATIQTFPPGTILPSAAGVALGMTSKKKDGLDDQFYPDIGVNSHVL